MAEDKLQKARDREVKAKKEAASMTAEQVLEQRFRDIAEKVNNAKVPNQSK
jgi:hypothetical protein